MDNLGTCVGRGAWDVRREAKQEKDKSRGKVWLSGAAGRRGKGRGSFLSLTTLSPFFCKWGGLGGGWAKPACMSGKIGVSRSGSTESKGSFCYLCGGGFTLLQGSPPLPLHPGRLKGLREVRSLAETAKATHGSQAGKFIQSRHRQSDSQ